TDEVVATAHHAIHGAHQRRRFAEAIEMSNHGDLERNGTIKARKAHGASASHRIAQMGRIHFNRKVAPCQAVMAVSRFDHDLSRILSNRLAETSGQFLLEVQYSAHDLPALVVESGTFASQS